MLSGPHQVHPKLLLSGPLYSCSWGKPCFLDPTKFIPSCCYQVLFTPVLEGTRTAWTRQVLPKLLLSGPLYSSSWKDRCCLDLTSIIPKLLLSGPLYSYSWRTAAAWTPSSSSQAAANRSSLHLFLKGPLLSSPCTKFIPSCCLTGPLYSCSWRDCCCLEPMHQVRPKLLLSGHLNPCLASGSPRLLIEHHHTHCWVAATGSDSPMGKRRVVDMGHLDIPYVLSLLVCSPSGGGEWWSRRPGYLNIIQLTDICFLSPKLCCSADGWTRRSWLSGHP